MNLLKKILRTLLLAPVALFLLFEEWGWEPLAAAFAALRQLPLWGRLERLIAGLPPWAALLAFGVPVVALLPIKLLVLYLLSKGHVVSGLVLLVGAKLAGTALLAWLFTLTQPALMRLAWFARWYPRWTAWKNRLMDEVRRSAPWQVVRQLKLDLSDLVRKLRSKKE